ncbi:MAG: NTPase [Granulosicoccaceae bacterium]|jgi:nucleoside-triphosphatase
MSNAADRPHILLLTGTPGIGKTTLVRKVATAMQQYNIAGFYTEEIREGGQRRGFRLVTFSGEQGIIAHVSFDHRYQVGKYCVDVAAIDRFADATLGIVEDIDVYFIDEIGKMECLSQHFVSHIQALLGSEKTVLATVGKKGGGLIETVKDWPGSELWEITHTNRDALLPRVVSWLNSRLTAPAAN